MRLGNGATQRVCRRRGCRGCSRAPARQINIAQDRQPFLVKRDGASTYVPLYREITHSASSASCAQGPMGDRQGPGPPHAALSPAGARRLQPFTVCLLACLRAAALALVSLLFLLRVGPSPLKRARGRADLWINDYNSQEAVDNDDGSCWCAAHPCLNTGRPLP